MKTKTFARSAKGTLKAVAPGKVSKKTYFFGSLGMGIDRLGIQRRNFSRRTEPLHRSARFFMENEMPEFTNPYQGNICKETLSKEDLIQALRIDIASEQEAILLYTAHANATTDTIAKKILTDIMHEEMIHTGQLIALIRHLSNSDDQYIDQGCDEANDVITRYKLINGK